MSELWLCAQDVTHTRERLGGAPFGPELSHRSVLCAAVLTCVPALSLPTVEELPHSRWLRAAARHAQLRQRDRACVLSVSAEASLCAERPLAFAPCPFSEPFQIDHCVIVGRSG